MLDQSSAIIEAEGDGKIDGGGLAQEEQEMKDALQASSAPGGWP